MNVSRAAIVVGLLALSSVATGATDPLSHANPLPAQLEGIVRDVTRDLRARGYEVERGYFSLWGIEQCKYAIKTVGNCFGNNPTSPYVLPIVPQWRDEFVDQKTHLVFGPMRRGYSATYRLGDREALVVLALLPPGGDYFGLQSYVFTREGTPLSPDDAFYKGTPPDVRELLFARSPNPSRVLVFASMGNSVNNVVIERQSGSAFDQQRFFIVSTDAVTEGDITGALVRADVAASDVFVEPVSSDLVRLGLGRSADDLLTAIRYIPFDDAGRRWQESLPLTVLRVRDTNTARATEPYPVPVYEDRAANSELPLAADLGSLISAVKAQWSQGAAEVTPFLPAILPPPYGIDLVGQHCLERPMNCLGDTQDTDTYRISKTVAFDGGEVIGVVGTLGTATGNATYVSLSVNRRAVLEGVANLKDEDLDGTASDFSGTVANTEKFYLYYFARDCTGLANCREITESEVPAGETIKLIQRNYIRPGTARGARAQDVLTPSMIVLDGSMRP